VGVLSDWGRAVREDEELVEIQHAEMQGVEEGK